METLLPPKGTQPSISADVCCGQTAAGWIKAPLGIGVDLGPGHIVLDGDPAPPPKRGTTLPLFLADVCCVEMVAHRSYC